MRCELNVVGLRGYCGLTRTSAFEPWGRLITSGPPVTRTCGPRLSQPLARLTWRPSIFLPMVLSNSRGGLREALEKFRYVRRFCGHKPSAAVTGGGGGCQPPVSYSIPCHPPSGSVVAGSKKAARCGWATVRVDPAGPSPPPVNSATDAVPQISGSREYPCPAPFPWVAASAPNPGRELLDSPRRIAGDRQTGGPPPMRSIRGRAPVRNDLGSGGAATHLLTPNVPADDWHARH